MGHSCNERKLRKKDRHDSKESQSRVGSDWHSATGCIRWCSETRQASKHTDNDFRQSPKPRLPRGHVDGPAHAAASFPSYLSNLGHFVVSLRSCWRVDARSCVVAWSQLKLIHELSDASVRGLQCGTWNSSTDGDGTQPLAMSHVAWRGPAVRQEPSQGDA